MTYTMNITLISDSEPSTIEFYDVEKIERKNGFIRIFLGSGDIETFSAENNLRLYVNIVETEYIF